MKIILCRRPRKQVETSEQATQDLDLCILSLYVILRSLGLRRIHYALTTPLTTYSTLYDNLCILRRARIPALYYGSTRWCKWSSNTIFLARIVTVFASSFVFVCLPSFSLVLARGSFHLLQLWIFSLLIRHSYVYTPQIAGISLLLASPIHGVFRSLLCSSFSLHRTIAHWAGTMTKHKQLGAIPSQLKGSMGFNGFNGFNGFE